MPPRASNPANRQTLEFALCDWNRTLVDCHSAFVAALAAAGRKHAVEADWDFVELAWEMKIRVHHAAIEFGHAPWRPHEELAADALKTTLSDIGLGPERFPASTCAGIIHEFARLRPWGDVRLGLEAIREFLPVATSSVVSSETMRQVIRLRGLQVDTIIGAELTRTFPPNLTFFRDAARRLRKPPGHILYISTDPAMLAGAAKAGMCTALLQRDVTSTAGKPTNINPMFCEPDVLSLAAALSEVLPARPHRDISVL